MNAKKCRGNGTVNPSRSCCAFIPDYRAAIPVELLSRCRQNYSAPSFLLVTSFTLSTPEFNLGTFKGLFR
jgi:hypothetical protein